MFNLFTIDAPYFYIDKMAGLKEEAEAVKNLGFTGKAAIHPDQIDYINEAFSPSAEEKAEAKKSIRGISEIWGRRYQSRRPND